MAELCEQCRKRPGEIRVTEVTRGRIQERMLCLECAREMGIDSTAPGEFSVSKLVAGMERAQDEPAKEPDPCPGCGLTFGEFRQTGMLGCAQCYVAFEQELSALLRRLHGALRHTGRTPGERTAEHAIQLELSALRKRLSDAVAREDYEEAARIRDRIRELKGATQESGEDQG